MLDTFETAYLDVGASNSHVFDYFSLHECRSVDPDSAETYRAFADFLESEQFSSFVRAVVGLENLTVRFPSATRYRIGQFYATHRDSMGDSSQVAAFVFNLTRRWEAHWGGLLQFMNSDGNVESAFLPKFNSLSIFLSSQPHGVSLVTPFAPHNRLSIAGQLEGHNDPI
jgi:Rps23 Pro-64 3,4-dihydroxylase Tpa1-like proline 4-hydroxylase